MRAAETRWRCGSSFVVRAPALPIEVFQSLTELRSPHLAQRQLQELLGDPYVALALAIASPSLDEALRARPLSAERSRRLVRPVLSYLVRMSTRATPFGLFAGVTRGEWGDRSEVDLGGRPSVKRARPDMDWLYALVQRLERDPDIRSGLVLRTHPTLRIRGGRAAVAGLDAQGSATGAAESSLRATPVVREALEMCRTAKRRSEVERELCRGTARDPVKTRELLDRLCDHGFLITSLRPPLTDAPARKVARELTAAGGGAAVAYALGRLLEQLEEWEELPVAEALDRWEAINATARALESRAPTVQVDGRFGADVRLPRSVALEASRAADLLFRLSAWPAGAPPLDRWRPQFEARYGQRRPIPLLELVDRGLPSLDVGGGSERARDRVLLAIAGDALRRGRTIVELDDERVAELEGPAGRSSCPPRSVDLFCTLAAASERDIDDGRFQLVVSGAAAPAGRSLGRFGHLFGGDETAGADVPVSADTLVAELHFEPLTARSGNVMIRAPRGTHAIHLGGGRPDSEVPVIPLDELAVTLEGSRLRLLWTREAVHVRAICSHLLNQGLAPALARFLFEVSRDGETVVDRFSWGAAEQLPALPRVQVGRVVLRTAEWTLDRGFLDTYERDRLRAVRVAGLPRHVLLGSAEPLLVDLLSDSGAVLLLAAGARLHGDRRGLRVTEALPGPEHAFARSGDGHRSLELVVPVATIATPPTSGDLPVIPRQASRGDTQRPPGSDWLYAKLYTASDLADELVGGPVRAFASALLAERSVSDWFFLRFADPDFHVRLRLRSDPARLTGAVLPRLCTWARKLMSDGLLDRFTLDTYDREIERYGGPEAIVLAERAFAADSVAVAELVARREVIAREIDWTHLGAWSVDDLLACLNIDRVRRAAWYRAHYAIYEHSAEFRVARRALRALLDPDARRTAGSAGDIVASILGERRGVLRQVADGLAELDRRNALWVPVGDIARSLVHMHCNRLCMNATEVEPRIGGLAGLTAASLAAWPPRAANEQVDISISES